MINKLHKSISKLTQFCTLKPSKPKSRNRLYAVLTFLGVGLLSIIGLSQSLKLLQNGHQVILIEREEPAATQCSAFNGNVYNPLLYTPFVSKQTIKTMCNNYINPSNTATKRFSLNSLRECNGVVWLLNAVMFSIMGTQLDQAIQDMTKLGRIEERELEKIKQLGLLKNQQTAEGEPSFFKSNEQGKKLSEILKTANIFYSRQSIQKFTNHLVDRNLFEIFSYVMKIEEYNYIDTKLLSMRTLKYCKENYPNQFKTLYGTELKDFVLNYDNRVLGINTNNGIIFGNQFVICAGLHSKYVAKKLALNLPIMPCRGWVIESELPQNVRGSVLDKMVLKLPTYEYLAVNQQIKSTSLTILSMNQKAQLLISQMKELFNIDLDKTKISVRDYCRPLTPDDKMILCSLNKQPNVYINAGHGSRGMSLSHGCAEIIYQIMQGNKKEYEAYNVTRFAFI